MHALLPRATDAVDVHEHYARDWLDHGGMRLDFVASADGAATAQGRSAGLQTPGDNHVFHALRDLADVILAGAGTVLVEGYESVDLPAGRVATRRRYGLAAALPTAVVSRSLRFDPSAALFRDQGDARTIVFTCAAAPADKRAALGEVADVVMCGDADVDLRRARDTLRDRGLTRVLCEGGPTLFAGLADAGVVDELCLSITPMLVGPGARRIVSGPPWPGDPVPLTLTGLLHEDGALFCRYRAG